MTKTNGSYIVSWDFTLGEDNCVLIVGKQEHQKVEIVNAFQGQEAYDIYQKLTTRKEKIEA